MRRSNHSRRILLLGLLLRLSLRLLLPLHLLLLLLNWLWLLTYWLYLLLLLLLLLSSHHLLPQLDLTFLPQFLDKVRLLLRVHGL